MQDWRPSHNPFLIAAAVMLPTFIEVLDTSIANVAMPYIAGNLSASHHEATWVLTSYLVANAIILPTADWFSQMFGRKRFLIGCTVLFTIFSAMCGLANSLGFLIVSRVLQGLSGGALQPLSQAILLESFPKEKRGFAMALFAMGVVVAPIIGPILGGWITDNYSWRWIFLMNLPLGVVAVFLIGAFVEDPPYMKKGVSRIDYIGFGLMALGLGLLQIILDKGQEVDWFQAPWLCWSAAAVVLSLSAFVYWELRQKTPIVNLRIFRDRNFSIGMVVVLLVGAVLYGITTLLSLYYQTVMGYSAYLSGLMIGPSGAGALVSAILVGILMGRISEKVCFVMGLCLLAASNVMLMNVNLDIAMETMLFPVVVKGLGLTMTFIPLATMAVGTLDNKDVGNGTGLFNLMRNIGGSVGIAMVSTMLARMTQVHQAHLVGQISLFNPVYQQTAAALGPHADALIYREMMRQAAFLPYIDCFRIFAFISAGCILTVFLFRRSRHQGSLMMH